MPGVGEAIGRGVVGILASGNSVLRLPHAAARREAECERPLATARSNAAPARPPQQRWNRPAVQPVFIGEEFFHLQDTGNLANFSENTLLLFARQCTGEAHDAFFHGSGNGLRMLHGPGGYARAPRAPSSGTSS